MATGLAPASWAAVLGLVTAAAGCASSGGTCTTDELPKNDPCYGKGCCESVVVGPDGGVVEDAGSDPDAGTTSRLCGACNG